jgi:hypothetical protein
MNFEEKIIRYVASKLIQKKYFRKKGFFPDEKKLGFYIEQVLEDLINQYRQLRLVRTRSPKGLITPAVQQSVDKLHIS